MRVSCPMAQDARGRNVPSIRLDPAAVWAVLSIEGDAIDGRVVVDVETDDPASILASEGVELIEG